MMFKYAITRKPGKNFAAGLTTANLGTPDYNLILKQHHAYVCILQSLGLEVEILQSLPEYPDAYFVEDVAIVTPEIAVITHPGAQERAGEANHIESSLTQYRSIARIQSPGTLDGGDVMQVGNHCYIGVSDRTNEEGARQLAQILHQYGYNCMAVAVSGGLHLKSDVSYIGRNTLLVTEALSESEAFINYDKILVDPEEAYAANSLLINNRILMPEGFPRTKSKLIAARFDIIETETSEVQKMDGGLSCMSLRF
jgi:dimethylargininase